MRVKRIDTKKYQCGSIILMATVTSVQLDKLYFHIFPNNLKELKVLREIFNAKDRKTYDFPPTAGIIFDINLDGGILRAIRCLPVSSEKAFLLDFGDIIDVESNLNIIFPLTQEERNIPAQAILCKLVDCSVEEDYQLKEADNISRNLLKNLLFKKSNFRVIENSNDILHLEVLPGADVAVDTTKEQPASNDKIAEKSKSYSHENISDSSIKTSKIKLSSENLEMLYEEPSSSANVVMSITGYIPKYDTQIYRNYDPNIDDCFKGYNCRQLHVPLRDDHITKDVMLLANAFSEQCIVLRGGVKIQYQPDDILTVEVTHVKDLEYFYGIILNNSSSNVVDEVSFSDIDIEQSDYLKKLPHACDIVLAKFVADGLWYRAEVIEVDEYNKTAKVFYMDYGNRQTVSLKNLARCIEHIAKIPPQAQLFHLADVYCISDTTAGNESELKRMKMISNMLLDEIFELSEYN